MLSSSQHINRLLYCRCFQKITKECEKTKADFASFERKDIKLREDLKHEKGKEKKLDATIAKVQIIYFACLSKSHISLRLIRFW